MAKITEQLIEQEIRDLGIREGDLVFITGGMKSIGNKEEIEGNLYDFFIPTLLRIIGKEGTLITYAYSKQYLLKHLKEDNIFTRESPSNSGGAIANIILSYKDSVRSTHPSSSCVAIGKLAHNILDAHTPNTTAYSVLGQLVKYNAKLIVFGCLDTNPGMPLLHYVEESLGLLKKNTSFLHLFKLNHGVYYFDKDGNKKLYIRDEKDVGGCYYGTYRLFEEYDSRKLWVKGNIGKSIAVQVLAKDSFNLEMELISQDNSILSCDDPYCVRCNLLTPRKNFALLIFFTFKIWVTMFRAIVARFKNKSIKDAVLQVKINYDIKSDPIFLDVVERINKKYS